MEQEQKTYKIDGVENGSLYFDFLPCLNFSMQHNHYNSLIACNLMNDSEMSWENIEITIEGEMLDTSAIHIDVVPPGTHIEIKDLSINVNPSLLIELTEGIDSKFRLIFNMDGKCLLNKEFSIKLMAYDQWTGISINPELLASFVTPNCSLLPKVNVVTSKFLEQWTGSSALDEYQSQNPNRVRLQVAAIYEALRNEALIYATIPASFEKYGQRIRTVDKVLTEKLATCIDLSILFASCLESIGINPILVFTKGHCFVGAWLVNDSYNKTVSDDGSFLLKSSSDGLNEIVVVESTCLTSSSPINFDEAVILAKNHLFEEQNFECFIDVYRARINGIRPLPLRVQKGDDWILENEGEAHVHATKEVKQYNRYDLSVYDNSEVKVTKMMLWERKLLDFSLRNNLLNMRLGKKIIPLVSFSVDKLEDYLQDGKSFQVFPFPLEENPKSEVHGMFTSEKYFKLENFVKTGLTNNKLYSFKEEDDLTNALKYVYRTSRTSMEENGANNLYLVLGVLKWFETERSEQPRLAPILLLPIEIIRGGGIAGYTIRTRDEEISLNITMVELLKQQHNINLSALSELPKDEHGVDVSKIFTIIRDKIRGKKGWDVLNESIIGLFSFNKFVMWNDIHSNSEKILQNDIISSLVDGKLKLKNIGSQTDARDLDSKKKPEDYIIPVDVDSSQLEAVIDSGEGKSFILYGPPGTGKSQTITNMIANALYQGRRVLFVAEKMAALSVVQSRLEKIGLAPFCLELHSNKATKTHFLEQMDEAINIIHPNSQEEYKHISDELFEKRQELIRYIEALHRKNPSGLSLYDCITSYLSISEEELDVDKNLLSGITIDKINKYKERIKKLDTLFKVSGIPATSPLKILDIKNGSSESEQLLNEQVNICRDSLNVWKIYKDKFSICWGIKLQETKNGIMWARRFYDLLISLPYFSNELFCLTNDGRKVEHIKESIDAGIRKNAILQELTSIYTSEVMKINVAQIEMEWNVIKNKWFLPKFFAKRSFFKKMRIYKSDFCENDTYDIISKLKEYANAEETIKPMYEDLSKLFGTLAYYGKEQWSTMYDIIKRLPSLLALLEELSEVQNSSVDEIASTLANSMKGNWHSFLTENKEIWNKLITSGEQVINSMDKINSVANIDLPDNDWCNTWLPVMDTLHANEGKFVDWFQWCNERREINNLGLTTVIDYIVNDNATGEYASEAFAKGVYHKLIITMINSVEELRFFNGLLFEETINKYKTLTSKFQEISKKELFCKLAAHIPSMTMAAYETSEVGILKRNIKNGGRGTSIRKIIDQIPNLLPKLCPCMLMSPISVAQYIDLDSEKFDLVIFDEASQMPTSESVGAIARGKSLVVVGDPKQMPPTSFFSTSQVDEDEADIDDMNSILDDCISLSMPSRYLAWHYRSKHESLISFSNSQYYDGKLITFPSIDDQVSKVTLRRIDGVYDKGRTRSNMAEAEAIVDEVKKRLADPDSSKYSIGIVSFSKVQQNLIEDLLYEELAKDPKLESLAFDSTEPIFIKNLENVQGDERDVILFSVGYGPDKCGKVSMNFGPLNNEGGERRLNVAVSRARYEMVVFSILRSEQIDLKRTQAAGVEGLKKFLEFAEKGVVPVMLDSVHHDASNSIALNIAEMLKKNGYDVKQNVGHSQFKVDIAVINPKNTEEYLLGILCDGDNYYATKTVRDREIVQPSVLKLLHWNIIHIWTLDWFERPEDVIHSILQRLDNITNGIVIDEKKPKENHVIKENIAEVISTNEQDKSISNPLCKDYQFADFQVEKSYNDVYLLGELERKNIKYQLQQLIDIEQPITNGLLCKRIVKIWGLTRVTNRVQALVEDILESLTYYKTDNGDNGFACWHDKYCAEDYIQYRVNSQRDILDIPYVEIKNAMKYSLAQQIAIEKDDLKRLTAQQLGFTRKGNNINNATEYALNELVKTDFASLQGGKVCKN
jgi:superfamily I DNA and/or RNA helicase